MGGSLIRTFSLGPTDTKLDPFWRMFLMAKGEILISIDTDGFLDPKLWGMVNSHFFSRTSGHQVRPIFVLFHNGRRWNFDSVDTDGFLDPKLWGVVNSHFFSRTNGHQARPILVLFLNGRRWNFDCEGSLIHTFSLGPTDTKLDPFWCFFLMSKVKFGFRWHRWIPWPKIVVGR